MRGGVIDERLKVSVRRQTMFICCKGWLDVSNFQASWPDVFLFLSKAEMHSHFC